MTLILQNCLPGGAADRFGVLHGMQADGADCQYRWTSPQSSKRGYPPVNRGAAASVSSTFDADVQRHDAGAQVMDVDVAETGGLHHRLQRLLVGVHPDRFGEVAVTVC